MFSYHQKHYNSKVNRCKKKLLSESTLTKKQVYILIWRICEYKFSQRKMHDRWTRHNMKKRLSNILVPTFSGYLFVTVYCIGSSQTKTRSMHIISWGWKGKSRFKYRQIDSKRMKIINCPILIFEDMNKY